VERHATFLGILTTLWGWISVILGVSMSLLAVGALAEALDPMRTSSEFLAVLTTAALASIGGFAMLWGGAHLWAAALLRRRSPRGRILSLMLAVVNLLVLPFGTAFGGYALWVLLSEPGRRLFEPPR
jgi:hypothetical protein